MRNEEPYKEDHWVMKEAQKILKKMGYDINQNINKQFLERHNLTETEGKKRTRRKKKDLPLNDL